MPGSAPEIQLTFEAEPPGFLSLCDKTFATGAIAVSILKLDSMQNDGDKYQAAWLHPQEIKKYESFTLAKRADEWLGGRICAKHSTQTILHTITPQAQPISPTYYRIQSTEDGRPNLPTKLGTEVPELSISHSKEFATAVCSDCLCGIDIQYTASTFTRVQDRFCNVPEEKILADILSTYSPINRLTLLWSAKEAAKKMCSPFGIPGFLELELIGIERHFHNNNLLLFSLKSKNGLLQVVTSLFHEKYGLALCCQQNRRNLPHARVA